MPLQELLSKERRANGSGIIAVLRHGELDTLEQQWKGVSPRNALHLVHDQARLGHPASDHNQFRVKDVDHGRSRPPEVSRCTLERPHGEGVALLGKLRDAPGRRGVFCGHRALRPAGQRAVHIPGNARA